eukprot:3943013-Pyramimonas_sp.AAC.1
MPPTPMQPTALRPNAPDQSMPLQDSHSQPDHCMQQAAGPDVDLTMDMESSQPDQRHATSNRNRQRPHHGDGKDHGGDRSTAITNYHE